MPALRVALDGARVAVRPAVADAEDEVGLQERGVAVAVARLQADHAGHEGVVVRDRAPAHERRDHGDARDLREIDQEIGRVGVDDAAAGDDQRLLSLGEHIHRLLDLAPTCRGLIDRQGFVGIDVELDLGHLDVDGQVDQHRTGPPRAHDMKRLLEDARHQAGLAHRHGPFGNRLGDRLYVDGLKILLVQLGTRRLARDAQNGQGIGGGGVEAGDHVGSGWSGRANANPDVARRRPGVTVGHVRGALDVAGEDVADATVLAHCCVEWVDGRAGDAERRRDTLCFQHAHRGFCCFHLGHNFLLPWCIAVHAPDLI